MAIHFQPPVKGHRAPQQGRIPAPYDRLMSLKPGESVDFHTGEFGITFGSLRGRIGEWTSAVRRKTWAHKFGPYPPTRNAYWSSAWCYDGMRFKSRQQIDEAGNLFMRVWFIN